MRTIAAYYFHAALCRLRRNPVLTTMMVYSVVFGVAVLMAAFAVWRASSSCPVRRWPEPLYVVQISAGIATRSDPLVLNVNHENRCTVLDQPARPPALVS